MSFEVNLRQMATDLVGTSFLAKLSGGDLVAIEEKYDFDCWSHKNKHRSFLREQNQHDELKQDEHFKAHAFAKLISLHRVFD